MPHLQLPPNPASAEEGGQRSAMRWLPRPHHAVPTAGTNGTPTTAAATGFHNAAHSHSRALAQHVAGKRRRQILVSTGCLLLFVAAWVYLTLGPHASASPGVGLGRRGGTKRSPESKSGVVPLPLISEYRNPKRPSDVFDDVPMDVEPVDTDAATIDSDRDARISKRELLMEDVGLALDTRGASSSSSRDDGVVDRGPRRNSDDHVEPSGVLPTLVETADSDEASVLSDSAIPSDDFAETNAPGDGGGLVAMARDTAATNNRAMIGPTASCNTAKCRLCGEMQVTNQPTSLFVPHETSTYLRQHILLSTVTGSFDNFFRMDVALCTWLGHVPNASLLVFTDGANKSAGRHGEWYDAALPPTLRFSKKQMQAQGYTIAWMRAQYRFIQAFQTMAKRSIPAPSASGPNNQDGVGRGPKASSGGDQRALHWAMVVDDDTFLNLNALQWLLTAYDVRELAFLGLVDPKTAYNDTTAPHLLQLISTHRAAFRPLYLNDAGWGGAGHFLNYAALQRFANGSDAVCVERYMVRKGYASDVALKKCLPRLGIHTVNEKHLSHCQAAFLKRRLTSGRLVSSHAKRDVSWPRLLAMWRMRLYYQVVYHRNHTTAYDLLMQVGACAYGYSCKLKKCDAAHDTAAMALFNASSGNNSFVPLL